MRPASTLSPANAASEEMVEAAPAALPIVDWADAQPARIVAAGASARSRAIVALLVERADARGVVTFAVSTCLSATVSGLTPDAISSSPIAASGGRCDALT